MEVGGGYGGDTGGRGGCGGNGRFIRYSANNLVTPVGQRLEI